MQGALTTEKIRKKFKNNFDLCNFSISIARGIIMGGESTATLDQILQTIYERACLPRD